jgi:hypothetical protein
VDGRFRPKTRRSATIGNFLKSVVQTIRLMMATRLHSAVQVGLAQSWNLPSIELGLLVAPLWQSLFSACI